jgi:hypothetical protein
MVALAIGVVFATDACSASETGTGAKTPIPVVQLEADAG